MIADAPSIPLTLTRTGARLFHFTQEMRGMELHRAWEVPSLIAN